MSRPSQRFHATRIAWHTRGRADTVLNLIAAGYLTRQQMPVVCDLLNLDDTDMWHADQRANAYTEDDPR